MPENDNNQSAKKRKHSTERKEIRWNEQFLYLLQPLRVYKKADKDGSDNFFREASTGYYAIEAWNIIDSKADSPQYTEFFDKSPSEREKFLTEKINTLTDNNQSLIDWIHYNAHINGPLGDMMTSLQSLMKRSGFDQFTSHEKKWHRYHLMRVNGDPNVLELHAKIAYRCIMQDDEVIQNEDGTPVAWHEIKIRARDVGGDIQCELIEEVFYFNNEELAIKANDSLKLAERQIAQYNLLVNFIQEIEANAGDSTKIPLLLKHHKALIQNPSLDVNYQAETRKLCNKLGRYFKWKGIFGTAHPKKQAKLLTVYEKYSSPVSDKSQKELTVPTRGPGQGMG